MADVNVTVAVLVGEAQAALSGLGKSMGDLGDQVATGAGKLVSPFVKMHESLTSVQGVLASMAGALASFQVGKAVVDANIEFERLSGSLKTVTGSAEAGQAAFKTLVDFAATTPFQLNEAVEAFIRMKGMGLDPSIEALRSFGNTAAAMGKPLMQFVESVADAATGEFERLKEFGILAKAQGDQVTFTFQGVSTTVGKNAAEITAYLKTLGETKFGSAMADQMNLLPGLFSNLDDSVAAFQRSIGEAGLNAGMKELLKSINALSVQGAPLAETLGRLLGGALETLAGAINKLSAAFNQLTPQQQDFAVKMVGLVGILATVAPVLGLIVSGLTALLSPVALVIAVVAALGVAVWQNWDEIKAAFEAGGKFVVDTLNMIVTTVEDFGGRLYGAIAEPFNSLAGVVTPLATAINDDLISGLNALGDALNWIMGLARDFATGLRGVVVDAVEPFYTALNDRLLGAFKAIEDALNAVLGAAGDMGKALGNLVSSVIDPFSAAVARVKDIAAGIGDYFAGVPADIAASNAKTEQALVQPFEAAAKEIYGDSIWPEMIDGVIAETDRFAAAQGKTLGRVEDRWQTTAGRIEGDFKHGLTSNTDDLGRFGVQTDEQLRDTGASFAAFSRVASQDVSRSVDDMVGSFAELPPKVKTDTKGMSDDYSAFSDAGSTLVSDFSSNAKTALSDFFMTGELSLDTFEQSMIATFADVGAQLIVDFVTMGIKAFVQWGVTMFTSMVTGATGMDIAAISALFLDTALGPILIVVLAIAAAMALLYFAGVDIGDIFKWIADIVGTVLKGAFQAFMAVVSGLVGIFEALVNVLSTFVGWIRTIGEELGKGDLKDLLKMFSGKGLFDAIGGGISGILGGIGNFFGGLFAEGGWVGGQGGVPIVAHAGEFVVRADAAQRHARLLEMINGGSDMHARVQTLGDLVGAARGGAGSGTRVGAGQGGDGGVTVHLHGSVISDGLSTSQVGRTLGRSIRKETKRLLGG